MKHIFTGALLLFLVFSLQAQDGIYGSFTVGQKIVNLAPLNDRLQAATPGGMGLDVEFVNNYWIFGGEGHIILGKHFVIGGKGFAMWNEEEVPDSVPKQTIKIVGGMGIGTLGYAFLAGADKQIRLIPQVGIGAASFLLQHKYDLEGSQGDFNNAFYDDKRTALTKVGLAIDLALAFDWYIKLIELVKIIPGLGFGPLIHAEAGYTIIPGNLEWMRDFDDSYVEWEPDIKFDGFYFNVGIGIGLSSSRQ
jgi:hypothetical protein